MLTQAHRQSLQASTPTLDDNGPITPIVDRASVLELRRSTLPAIRDQRVSRPRIAAELTCPPTSRARELATPSMRPSRVSVVIVPAPPLESSRRGDRLSWSRIKLDLSWVAAVVVALSVTIALAIPLELFRQHG